ncbi:MAG: hypothetical protein WA324_30715 [Bryobacteraceae bacterium]
MNNLPASPDFSFLKKQAEHLLRDARLEEADALKRFTRALPFLKATESTKFRTHELKLHDAQSVIARENGFPSWTELKRYVEWKQIDRAERLKIWFEWAYQGTPRKRKLAARMLREEPKFFEEDLWLAFATGDVSAIERLVPADAGWPNLPGGRLKMPPLAAVTHSLLILEGGFEAGFLKSARFLLQNGADVNSSWTNPKWPDAPLSALYGAVGRTHNVEMTKLLLDAGADPNDNESLYHSVESRDSTCTRLLLQAGTRVSGTNAIGRVLDYDKLSDLELMLHHGGDAKESPWIHHAILRGRSLPHIQVLIAAGADLRATNCDGITLYRWAQMHGRADVVELLRHAGIEEPLTEEEQFVAACARGDAAAGRAIQQRIPDIFSRLNKKQLQTLPELASVGNMPAVHAMLEVGWPREVKAAWDATALNLAVYRGDARMAELLLDNGADWRTVHGFKDNVLGSLAYASQAEIEDPAPGDYVGCAKVLIAHGVPLPDGDYHFSAEVTEYFDSVRLGAG